MKVEILFDEMGGFECYCTASSLFLILLFSVCSIRHVCSSEALMADSDSFLCWSRLSGSFTVRSNPRSNPGTSLRPAFDTAPGFHGTPILERLLWVFKYSFLDTSEFTSPGYFSQQKKPPRDMYFV